MCKVQVYIRFFSVNILKKRTDPSCKVPLLFPYLNFHLRSCVVLTNNQSIYYRKRVSERVQKQSRVDQHPPDRCCRFVHWAPLHRHAALSSRPFSEWPKCLFPLKGDCPLIRSFDVNSLSSSLFSSASFINFFSLWGPEESRGPAAESSVIQSAGKKYTILKGHSILHARVSLIAVGPDFETILNQNLHTGNTELERRRSFFFPTCFSQIGEIKLRNWESCIFFPPVLEP